jgi:cell division septation protein DedD
MSEAARHQKCIGASILMVHLTNDKGRRNGGFVRFSTLAGAAIAAAFAVPAAADVKAGVDAWSAGDYPAAVAQWQLPENRGDADALFNLAQAYRLGRGVETDIARARELYAEAAKKGHLKAADNYGLLLFQQGEQLRAMPLIRAAAVRGDPRAQYVLGLAHFNGDYADKNWTRAYALLTLASGAGLPQASAALGEMDEYVPLSQRQEAQVVARKIESEAAQRRATQLASFDLGPNPAPPVAASLAPRPVPIPARTVSEPGPWRIQLGAFGVASNADRLWNKVSSNPALSGTRKALVPGGKVTRLHAVGFASRRAAQAACSQLKAQGQACMVAGKS